MPVTRRLLPAAVAAAAAALLGGCAQVGTALVADDTATRDTDSGEVTAGGRIDVFALSVGDCLDDQSEEQVYDVPVVPCSEPHAYEVFHEAVLPDGAWPGEESVWAAADEACYAAFSGFVELPYEESVLEFTSYTPTQVSWEEGGDRIVSCIIGEPGVQSTGSLAGATR